MSWMGGLSLRRGPPPRHFFHNFGCIILKLCSYVRTIKTKTKTKFGASTYSFVATAAKMPISELWNCQNSNCFTGHNFWDKSIKLHRILLSINIKKFMVGIFDIFIKNVLNFFSKFCPRPRPKSWVFWHTLKFFIYFL